MPKANAFVSNVSNLSTPYSALEVEAPATVTVNFETGRFGVLDLSAPRARAWLKIIDHLHRAAKPVYTEIDPQTNFITTVLIPETSRVVAITTDPDGDVSVAFDTAAARHYLQRRNPDFQEMLGVLQMAIDKGLEVLVTATRDDHEIIDVKLLPKAPALEVPVIPPPVAPGEAPPSVSEQRAKDLFNAMSAGSCDPCTPSAPCIPFMYPDDGCYARAHEMCRLMQLQGEQPEKVWIFGYPRGNNSLFVKTANHPSCHVNWWYHVAPTLLVDTPNGQEIRVIDPSLCYGPVSLETWKGIQTDPNAIFEYTTWERFFPSGTEDPTFQLTNYYLEEKRGYLQDRCEDPNIGPPPYSTCHSDIYVRDNLQDMGAEPLAGGGISASPDINHFRQELIDPQSTLGTAAAKAQDNLFEPIEIGQTNYIYLRIQNRGYAAATVDVDIYYGLPSTLPTPSSWHLIGSLTTSPIVPGEFKVVGPLAWSQIPQKGHYCFVAVLGNAQDPKPDLTTVHTINDFYTLVRQHNNVTWKNFDVDNLFAGGEMQYEFWIQGWPRIAYFSDLEIDLSELPLGCMIELRLLKRLVEGSAIQGMMKTKETENYAVFDVSPHGLAAIRNMQLKTSDRSQARLTITLDSSIPDGGYRVHALQKVEGKEVGRVTKFLLVGEYPYVANLNSDEVHLANCVWVRKMNPRHRSAYNDLQLARKHGYNGCRYCLPEIDTG